MLLRSITSIILLSTASSQRFKWTDINDQYRNAITDFAQDAYLYMSEVNQNDNFVFSPLSLHTAMSMVYLGAKDGSQTKDQLARSLGGLVNSRFINKAYNHIMDFVKNNSETILFGNNIWVKKGYGLKPGFTDNLAENFNAGVDNLDFGLMNATDFVNDWVAENTNGKITEFIDSFDPDTAMFIANALYFKESWLYEFDAVDLKGEPIIEAFNTINGEKLLVPMMEQSSTTLDYQEFELDGTNAKFEVVKVPYINPWYEMKIIVPAEFGKHLSWLESFAKLSKDMDINGEQKFNFFRNLSDSGFSGDVNLKMPTFKIHSKTRARNLFEKLQVTDLFSKKAELDNISDVKPLNVNDILHEALIEVTPTGTEGAAATGVEIVFFSAGSKAGKNVVVNKPFIFVLEDTENKIPVLVGRVMNPMVEM